MLCLWHHARGHTARLQAFDGYVKGLLRKRYPPELMLELQTAFGGAIQDLVEAFPDKTYAQTSNMQTFLKVSLAGDHLMSSADGP